MSFKTKHKIINGEFKELIMFSENLTGITIERNENGEFYTSKTILNKA